MSRARVTGIAVTAIALIAVMSFTGPDPETDTSGPIVRRGGVCLQLEQWGLFGWVIVGQSHTEADIEEANWHTPPSSSPPCQEVVDNERDISLPSDLGPDVYRLCGLADSLGCLEFTLAPAESSGL